MSPYPEESPHPTIGEYPGSRSTTPYPRQVGLGRDPHQPLEIGNLLLQLPSSDNPHQLLLCQNHQPPS